MVLGGILMLVWLFWGGGYKIDSIWKTFQPPSCERIIE